MRHSGRAGMIVGKAVPAGGFRDQAGAPGDSTPGARDALFLQGLGGSDHGFGRDP